MKLFHSALVLLALSGLAACRTSKSAAPTPAANIRQAVVTSPVFNAAFTGFMLQDAATGEVYCDYNADKLFTPASNTKIITLATCLKVLGDSLTGMQYRTENGQLYVRGTGDPTCLHPSFRAWQPAVGILKRELNSGQAGKSILFMENHWQTGRFGAGWSWDDYNDDYSPERSAFPVFGNCMDVAFRADGKVYDRNTNQYIHWWPYMPRRTDGGKEFKRLEHDGHFLLRPDAEIDTVGFSQVIPFGINGHQEQYVNGDFLEWALADQLGKITVSRWEMPDTARFLSAGNAWHTVKSCPVDTVYRRLMYQSDNFIAEQLLLQCAWQLSDTLKENIAIKYAINRLLPPANTPVRWVDGSGLSRYNLFSPRFISGVLRQMYAEQPRQRLFNLFPAGGVSGTIQDWYSGADGKPFVFAKTGSMSGVHTLSGYIVAKSGKVLIFSFMHNNFVGSNKAWKAEMQRVLAMIRETY